MASTKLTPPKTRTINLGSKKTKTIDPKLVTKAPGTELVEESQALTREDAFEFLNLLEEQRNAEQVERNRRLRIHELMRKAGCRTLLTMEHVIRRLVKR